jgi:hypothetical protein
MFAACFLTFFGVSSAAQPPLPAFIPHAPDKTKDLASYTASDVFSCVATAELPKGHPIEEILTVGPLRLKAGWPGARDGTQIDAILNLVLDATTPATKDDARKALQDVRFVLHFVMDLADTAKADAIIRVAQQQTDPLKKRLMANLAADLFRELYDPRLLVFNLDFVDDATKFISPPRSEGRHQEAMIAGDLIWSEVSQALEDVGFDSESLPSPTSDRAASKAAFKAWMTAHMAEASQKCEAYKARPGFKVNPPSRKCWSARP